MGGSFIDCDGGASWRWGKEDGAECLSVIQVEMSGWQLGVQLRVAGKIRVRDKRFEGLHGEDQSNQRGCKDRKKGLQLSMRCSDKCSYGDSHVPRSPQKQEIFEHINLSFKYIMEYFMYPDIFMLKVLSDE